jgi:two-component system NtrC family sensor kinase
MRRRSRAGGKTPTGQRRKPAIPKRLGPKRAVPRRGTGANTHEAEIARLTRERDEALEREKASAEVLSVISSSPGELKPVFESMLANAMRICEAQCGFIYQMEAGAMHAMAEIGVPPALAEYRRHHMHTGGSTTPVDVMRATKKPAHVHDARESVAYRVGNPNAVAGVDLGGARTVLYVPMLKENEIVGVINVYRQEVRPFADEQIALLENFAAQAVIAIENTRLLGELRQRTDDLTESLEQQTATSKVLEVISRSAFDLQAVFETVAESSVRLCGADRAFIFRYDGQLLRMIAAYNSPPEFEEWVAQHPIRPGRHSGSARAALERRTIHIPDVRADPEYTYGAKEAEAIRTILGVPIIKGDELLGVMMIYRLEVRPFTDKQIELVQTFADQAAIAIENVRLFEAEQQRTRELTDALEQQTATADVLKVISNSPGELEPVFQAMLVNGTRLCEAKFGIMWLREGDGFRCVALHNVPTAFAEERGREPLIFPPAGSPLGRVARTRLVAHIADITTEQGYAEGSRPLTDLAEFGGARTVVAVPMLKDEELIGAITIYRQEVRSFTDKQVELVTNFAAQAVIAIENTRLLSELRESLQQQTATADVLKVISRSTFDLPAVLGSLVESAARLCGADKAQILRPTKNAHNFYAAASYGHTPEYNEYLETLTFAPGREGVVGRVLLERKPVQIADVLADPDYRLQETQRLGGFRTHLGVPLLREGNPIGMLVVSRVTVKPFHENHIELLVTFADQAVIAIENVRLFDDVQRRTQELSESLDNLRTAQDRLVQTEKLASLGQLTAGIAHEIKNPLNFINNFSAVSVELIDELRDALAGAHLDAKLREEINEIADMLQGNLVKVVQHGQRADSIVKNMLLHSRQGSGEHRRVDINALVEESLNLAYHGARAEKQGFDISLERSFDPAAGEADLFPQDITRVLLNLISNGFYAATKRKAEVDGGDYEPTLTAATKDLGHSVEIRIRDNGTGIGPDIKEKMFNPFFTTKPAGEGTGLGLSISHDIIVKQHGGSIEVDTKPGAFTEIRIVLPRAGASLVKPGERAVVS